MSDREKQLKIDVIPALPGWFALLKIHDGDGNVIGLHREPVIAWEVETVSPPDPELSDRYSFVTAICVYNDGPPQVLERPDGSVTVLGMEEHPSAASYRSSLKLENKVPL